MAKGKGAKGQKIGRNGRAASNTSQVHRTAANKERHKRAAKWDRDNPKEMRVPRGSARALRRMPKLTAYIKLKLAA